MGWDLAIALAGSTAILWQCARFAAEVRDAIAIARKIQERGEAKITEVLESAKALKDGESIAVIVGASAFEISRVRVTFEAPQGADDEQN